MQSAHQQAANDAAPQHDASRLDEPQHNDMDEYSSDDNDFDDMVRPQTCTCPAAHPPPQDDPRLAALGSTHCLDAAGHISVQASAAVSASIRVRSCTTTGACADGHHPQANEAKATSKAPQRKDKSDRATVEQAIDPRTRRVCVIYAATTNYKGNDKGKTC